MLSVILIAILQASAPAAPLAVTDDVEDWAVEYPRLVKPFVDDYYNCLKSSIRVAPDNAPAEFEKQHAADLPRCAPIESEARGKADAELALSGRYPEYPPEQMKKVFETIGKIHIARGRDLDKQLRQNIYQYPTYDEAYRQTPAQSAAAQEAGEAGMTTQPNPSPESTDDAKN